MANDDLVPDEALVARLEQAASAIQIVADMAGIRGHLPREELASLAARAYELAAETSRAAQPDDEINAKYRSRMRGEFLTTSMGVKFYPFDPKIEEVTHLDVIIGLVNSSRYNGQTSRPSSPSVPRPISVAEHSIKAAAIAEFLAERDGLDEHTTRLACLHALLHDAHEAYMGDIIRPIKVRLYDALTGQPIETLMGRVQDAILGAYMLGVAPAEVYSIVEEADLLAYTCEVMTARRQSIDEDNQSLPIVDPDVLAIGRIRPDAPTREFLLKLLDGEIRRLVSLVGGRIPGPQGAPLDAADPTLDPSYALERLAQLKQVPGDRGYKSLGVEEHQKPDVGFIPNLSREPGAGDVSASTWRDAIAPPTESMPARIMAELRSEIADPKTTDLKRAVLQEELERITEVSKTK